MSFLLPKISILFAVCNKNIANVFTAYCNTMLFCLSFLCCIRLHNRQITLVQLWSDVSSERQAKRYLTTYISWNLIIFSITWDNWSLHKFFSFCILSLTLSSPNYSIGIFTYLKLWLADVIHNFKWVFTYLKLCLADAIHNFKWVKIIQIWQKGGQQIPNLADWCHFLSLTG